MKEREGRKDVETLIELTKELGALYEEVEQRITDSKDALTAWSSMGWLKRFTPEFMDMIEASGSIDSGYITQALEHMILVEKSLAKYQRQPVACECRAQQTL